MPLRGAVVPSSGTGAVSTPPRYRLATMLLATMLLGGCAAGGRFAPVDEVGVGAAPAAAVVTPGPATAAAPATAPGSGESSSVRVRTLPEGTPASPSQPLAEGAATGAPRSGLPAPVNTNIASAAPAPASVPASLPAARTLSAPVAALVADADQRAAAGQHDGAAASIERALQIEPGNAWLWYRLARERLAQGRSAEAENLAARSNSLASGDVRLQGGNWRVIEQARRQRGDSAGAEVAARRAQALETG